jgi:hypothetical protein
MMRLVLILPLTLLAGCQPEKPPITSTFPEGFHHSVGPGRLEKVLYAGDASVDAATAQQNVMRRAAEIAQEKNKKYFLVYDSLNSAAVGRLAEQPTVGTIGGTSTAFVFIRLLAEPERGARETAKVLNERPNTKSVSSKPKK